MSEKDHSDFDPKHRIIGAVIVVSLAVIFVPMILDRREAPAELSASDEASAGGAQTGESKVVVTPVRPEPRKQTAKVEVPAPAPSAARPTTPETASSGAPSGQPAAVAKPARKPESKTAALKDSWMVQVGTFTNSANATRLEEQLKKHGHPVRTERVALDSGNAVRLRVGPFADKALAVKAQAQIHKQVGVQGVVLAYP